MEKPILFENEKFYEIEKYFSKFGSELDLFQFFFSEIPENDYDFSAFVAQKALKSLWKRNEQFFEQLDREYQSQYYLNLCLYGNNTHIEEEGAKPKGKQISLNEFLGESYDLKHKEMLHPAKNGLSYALLCPPHGIRYEAFIRQVARELGRKKLKNWERLRPVQTKFFNHFLAEIGLDINEENELLIYEWDDNWSAYFDAGKEWWGTFCWTILNKSKGEITVIAASTTD